MLVKKYLLLILILVAASSLFYYIFRTKNSQTPVVITNFEECVKAGYAVQESFPQQCLGPDGKKFTKSIEDKNISVTGEVVCLPHKQKEGPQTLECAFGVKDQNGLYYALSDPDLKYLSTLPTGKSVTVEGVLKSDTDSIYDIIGVIIITSVTK